MIQSKTLSTSAVSRVRPRATGALCSFGVGSNCRWIWICSVDLLLAEQSGRGAQAVFDPPSSILSNSSREGLCSRSTLAARCNRRTKRCAPDRGAPKSQYSSRGDDFPRYTKPLAVGAGTHGTQSLALRRGARLHTAHGELLTALFVLCVAFYFATAWLGRWCRRNTAAVGVAAPSRSTPEATRVNGDVSLLSASLVKPPPTQQRQVGL